jgi:hypothetical protein
LPLRASKSLSLMLLMACAAADRPDDRSIAAGAEDHGECGECTACRDACGRPCNENGACGTGVACSAGSCVSAKALHICADPTGVTCPEAAAAFDGVDALALSGTTYADVVPDTLDLAQWGKDYYHGALATFVPSSRVQQLNLGWLPDSTFVEPQESVYSSSLSIGNGLDDGALCKGLPPPCFDVGAGSPQWGIYLDSIRRAREMAGNDVSAADEAIELASVRGLLQHDQNTSIAPFNAGETPAFWFGYTLMLLDSLSRELDSSAVKSLTQEYLRVAQRSLTTDGTYSYWFNAMYTPPDVHILQVSQQAYGGQPMPDLYLRSGDPLAFELSTQIASYLLGYRGGLCDPALWPGCSPDLPDAQTAFWGVPGVFYTGGSDAVFPPTYVMLITDALARYRANPGDPTVRDEVLVVTRGYEAEKATAPLLGNFNDTYGLGAMLQIAVRLEQFRFIFPDLVPMGTYYEDAERWLRNEGDQIRVDPTMASYIADVASGDPMLDHVGTRAIGTFLSSSGDALAIASADFVDNNDGMMMMRGSYEVWSHTVEVQGNVAWVNAALNNASRYVDVYSEIPYRGLVRVKLRGDLGPITEVAVRIPSWTDASQVSVSMEADGTGQAAPWSWNGPYVVIGPVSAGATYDVRFPMKVQHLPVTQTSWDTKTETFDGTFLGDTLVDVDHRPSQGIPRFQRASLAALASGGAAVETAAPVRSVIRFVAGKPRLLAGPVSYVGDFNHDGRADLLFRHISGLTVQLQNGVTSLADSPITNDVWDASWEIAGVADFNGDGNADVLLRHSTDGALVMQLQSGATSIGGGYITNDVWDPGWMVAGVADFDGDHKIDLLLRRSSDGALIVQLQDGVQSRGGGAITNDVWDSTWLVAGVADFDGDGRADILLRSSVSGALLVQLQDATRSIGGGYITNDAWDNSWEVVAAADFNDDCRADILLREKATGIFVVQLQNGLVSIGGGQITNNVWDPSWSVAGVADFNGDGSVDILLRHSVDGRFIVQLQRGLTSIGGGAPSHNAWDPAWRCGSQ